MKPTKFEYEPDKHLYVWTNNPLDAVGFFGLSKDAGVSVVKGPDDRGRYLFAVTPETK